MYILKQILQSANALQSVFVPYPAMAVLSSYFLQLSRITPFSLISDNPADHLKEATSHEILKQRYDI